MHFLKLTKGAKFREHILIELIKVLLSLLVVNLNALLKLSSLLMGVQVHVMKK